MKGTGRRKILILAFTLVVVMLGFGLVIPIFPFYIEQLGASGRELGLLVAVIMAFTIQLTSPWLSARASSCVNCERWVSRTFWKSVRPLRYRVSTRETDARAATTEIG